MLVITNDKIKCPLGKNENTPMLVSSVFLESGDKMESLGTIDPIQYLHFIFGCELSLKELSHLSSPVPPSYKKN